MENNNEHLYENTLNLLSLNNIKLLKMNKKNWCINDKRQLLSELESNKKKKIKELKNQFKKLNSGNIDDIKQQNNKLLSEIDVINKLETNINDNNNYNNLKNLTLLNSKNKLGKKEQLGGQLEDQFIEVYSNQ
jgi:hypothetical protein